MATDDTGANDPTPSAPSTPSAAPLLGGVQLETEHTAPGATTLATGVGADVGTVTTPRTGPRNFASKPLTPVVKKCHSSRKKARNASPI